MSARLTVYKYDLPTDDRVAVQMPRGARVLSVANQRDTIVAYALVDPTADLAPRVFRVAGTGHPIDPNEIGPFVGTVLLHFGVLVFHVFDCGEVAS